jgi:lauroyl/myristoyl acyltransferase
VGTPAPGTGGAARLQIRIEPLQAGDLPAADAGERILTQRIADALTDRIEALAMHWPWMHPSFDVEQAVPVRAAVAAAT